MLIFLFRFVDLDCILIGNDTGNRKNHTYTHTENGEILRQKMSSVVGDDFNHILLLRRNHRGLCDKFNGTGGG